VIPVQARVGKLQAVGEATSDRDRDLGLVRHPVVLVLQPQPVPVHRGVQITIVGDVDDDLRILPNLERGSGDGAVVAQHPHRGVPQPLGDRADAKIQLVAVGELDQRRPGGLRQSGRVGGERLGRSW
jgi:hypothetical protein